VVGNLPSCSRPDGNVLLESQSSIKSYSQPSESSLTTVSLWDWSDCQVPYYAVWGVISPLLGKVYHFLFLWCKGDFVFAAPAVDGLNVHC
jgi:hypothetical protein